MTIQNIIDRYGYKPKKGFISCPFHNEKTPSLRIYTDTNTFYCFGCGMGGDVISFVAHLFKMTILDLACVSNQKVAEEI